MEKLFPDMPVNAGVDKFLAVTTSGIGRSAHALLSLSFLIIPVSLAVAIKLFHWLGPFVAAGAVFIPVAALLYAEACLAEQGILPLPGGRLHASKAGKPISHIDEKDEDKAPEMQDLLTLIHGAIPPDHSPGPYAPSGEVSSDSNGQIPVSSMQASGPRISEFSSSRPTMPVSEPATVSGAVELSAGPDDTSDMAARSDGLSKLNQILHRTSEVLYGKGLSQAPETIPEALHVLNKLRVSIGLPQSSGADLSIVLAAAKETASTVGC